MKLIKNGTLVDPDWFYGDQAEGLNKIGLVEKFLKNPILSAGIQIDVDTDLDHIAQYLDQIELIVIEFSAYADGRGFSIAHRLRHTFGFTGKIWGSGSLIPDQYVMALQCGIDAVLVNEQLLQRQPIEHWQEALTSTPTPYRYHGEMMPMSADNSKASSL